MAAAVHGRPMPVSALVRAASPFGIQENNVRVTLARLVADGLLERNERGQYVLAPSARAVQAHVEAWNRLEERVGPWRGGWLTIHTATLPAEPRPQARRRRRALELFGLRELERNLWVRPDNLTGGLPVVHARLQSLGLEPSAPIFAVRETSEDTERRMRALWDVEALHRSYAEMSLRLESSLEEVGALPLDEAVVHVLLLGSEAQRLLAFDPLLPEPLVDRALRSSLVGTLRRYVRSGEARWLKFLGPAGANLLDPAVDSPEEPGASVERRQRTKR